MVKTGQILSLCVFQIFCSQSFLISQDPCRIERVESEFNVNKIRTHFDPAGNKFTTSKWSGFQVPFPGPNFLHDAPSTIDAGGVWIGAFYDGMLHLAAERYGIYTYYDFSPGPLDTNGLKYPDGCLTYNRVWSVFKEDILRHRNDFESDGQIDVPISSIFGWPAEGNGFFFAHNGFQLPRSHAGEWATFTDINQNGFYDPDQGEYPCILIDDKIIVPDQISWMVFNDVGSHTHSISEQLNAEIQLTVFGFFCKDNRILNHAVFNSYKIINQSKARWDSLYFGMYHDYNIGCDNDDYVGCDSIFHVEYAYNAFPFDGDTSHCFPGEGYGYQTPIQSMMYLSHPMHSFIREAPGQCQVDIEYYRALTGRYRNGMRITSEGDGFNPGSIATPTNYLFHGDPRDTSTWSAFREQVATGNLKTVSSVYLDSLSPREFINVETVYLFHQDTLLSHLGQFDNMYVDLQSLQDFISDPQNTCDPQPVCISADCVWPGDFNSDQIADERDLLYWGVANNSSGPVRNGLISWRGHFAENWNSDFPDQINFKHSDANGDGQTNSLDLGLNLNYYDFTTPDYVPYDTYPEGPEIRIEANLMEPDGDIGNIRVVSGLPLNDLYGLSFELEYDTFFYSYSSLQQSSPFSNEAIRFTVLDDLLFYTSGSKDYGSDTRFSIVETGLQATYVPEGFSFLQIPLGLKNKHQLPIQFLPEQFILRIKNLQAIDQEGNDLEIGSMPLEVLNPFWTSINPLESNSFSVYPNPADQEIYFISQEVSDYRLYTMTGQILHNWKVTETQAKEYVGALSPGLYFIKSVKSGTVAKFIKQ